MARLSRGMDTLLGTIAGVSATVTMTAVSDKLFRQLPRRERYPLPQRELTERIIRGSGLRRWAGEDDLVTASLVSHVGLGALAGGLFGLLLRRGGAAPVRNGVLYSLGLWTATYMGWAPALRLLRPAHTHPPRRTGLMIAAHLVWGAALGMSAQRLAQSLETLEGGRIRDR